MGNVLEGRRKIVRINHFNRRKTSKHRKEQRTSRNLFLGSIRRTAFRITSVGSLAIWSFKLLSLRCPIYLQKTNNESTHEFNTRMTKAEWHGKTIYLKLHLVPLSTSQNWKAKGSHIHWQLKVLGNFIFLFYNVYSFDTKEI